MASFSSESVTSSDPDSRLISNSWEKYLEKKIGSDSQKDNLFSSCSSEHLTSFGSESFSDDEFFPISSSKILSARSKKVSQLTEEEYFVHKTALKELRKIVSHPHIQAHPTHWLTRFASPDSSLENIVENIYASISKPRKRVFKLLANPQKNQKMEEVPSPVSIPSPASVSYEHFCKLYDEERRSRYYTYKQTLSCQLERFKYQKVGHLIRELDTDEGVFNVGALQYLGPSLLLQCAVQANYWEDISLLVKAGGVLPVEFFVKGRFNNGLEWISIYRSAYVAKHGHLPNLEGLSFSTSSSKDPEKA